MNSISYCRGRKGLKLDGRIWRAGPLCRLLTALKTCLFCTCAAVAHLNTALVCHFQIYIHDNNFRGDDSDLYFHLLHNPRYAWWHNFNRDRTLTMSHRPVATASLQVLLAQVFGPTRDALVQRSGGRPAQYKDRISLDLFEMELCALPSLKHYKWIFQFILYIFLWDSHKSSNITLSTINQWYRLCYITTDYSTVFRNTVKYKSCIIQEIPIFVFSYSQIK